jgi:peroxiredoxin
LGKILKGANMSLVKTILFLLFFIAVSLNAAPPDKAENFTLKDYNGKEHSLSDYKDSKAIVIIFVATECPISNDYNSRMADLYESYKDKDVAFLGINSNKAESVSEIKEHAKKYKLEFPILKDEKNKIADKFNASVTPEVYILNSDYEILYQGRIDDSRDKSNISNKDMAEALNEILAGKKVSNARTKAFGCTIKRV